MMVKEVMRPARGVGEAAALADVAEAIETTGCEAVPVVRSVDGELVVSQLVTLRDLPKLRKIAAFAARGHVVGQTVLDLLAALGREPGRFATISPSATLTDAWGIMCEECTTHLPVVVDRQVIGIVSLTVAWNEFPDRSPTAAFWP
jgi:signal-transduction protein with cAMP-binding, CBS, and nucleotidyltransferase domain